MDSKLSRRNFLKGAAAGSVGMATLSLLGGCAPTSNADLSNTGEAAPAADGTNTTTQAPAQATSTWKVAPEPVSADQITATYDADAIVVGHGHAGITACREIAEEGKKVICIEQQSEENYMPNGNEGGIINNSYLMDKQGVPAVDPIDFFNNWQVTTGNTANPALLMKYCQNSGENSDWYLDGLTEEQLDTAFIAFRNCETADPAEVANGYYDKVQMQVGPYKSYTSSLGFYGATTQTDIHKLNREAAKAAGAEFYFDTTAKYLVTDDSGAVTGVVATDIDGNYVQFNAPAVVLATGGFGCNAEMIKDLCADVIGFATAEEVESLGTSMDNRFGDGIQMAYWVGAQLEGGGVATMGMKSSADGWPSGIWLDETGNRYCNEFWGQAEQRGNHAVFMPRENHYVIYGNDLFDTVQYCTPSHGSNKPNMLFMDCLQQAMDQAVDTDDIVEVEGEFMTHVSLYGANTVAELLKKMGCTDETVIKNAEAQIERYNQYCADGADQEFGRDASLMWPLAEGPFYGQVKKSSVGSALTTMGGLVTNGEQQVLDQNSRPIPGLLASGNTTGRRFGRDYFTPISGMSLGFGWVLGRECGKSVVAWLDQQ